MKTHGRAALLATTMLISLGGAAVAAPNLVSNGDFEATLTGWLCTGGGSCADAAGGNPGSAFSGFDDFGTTSVSQTLSTAPGIYLIQYDFKDDGNSGSSLAMQFGVNAPIGVAATNAYQTESQILGTSTASTDIAFSYSTACCTSVLRVDNVFVTQVDDAGGPVVAAASQSISVNAARDFLDRLQSRFAHAGSPIETASVRETVLASAGGTTYVNAGGKYRAFMNVFGSHGEWNNNATETDRRGLSAGIEIVAGSGFDVGAAFAFGRSDFDTKGVFTTSTGDAYEYLGAVYAHWTPSASMPLYVNVLGGYGASSNDFFRSNIAGTGTADDVGADQWFGSVEVGWDWNKGAAVVLTPYVRFDAATLDQDGYTETATGLFVPAAVASQDLEAYRSILGLRAVTDIPSMGKYGAKVGGKVGWAHEFEEDRVVAFSQTVGLSTFTGTGSAAQPAEDSVVAGANIEFAISGDTSIFAGYDGNFAGNQVLHAGEAGVRITW